MADPVSLAINAALVATSMALTASQSFEGPRLDDLKVTTADYGQPLNYFYGVRRFDGVTCIWAEPLTEVKRQRKTKGGKFNEYTYYGTWAVAVADVEVDEYLQVFFDRNLVYDATGAGPVSPFTDLGDITQYMTFYYGTTTQDVDPRMAASVDAIHGADSTPAYRGVAYIVFKDLPLEKLGNRLPQVTVVATTAGSPAYPYETFTTAVAPPFKLYGFTYSPDGSRMFWLNPNGDDYEIWDVAARALMISGTLDVAGYSSIYLQDTIGIGVGGSLWVLAGIFGEVVHQYAPDGLGAPLSTTTLSEIDSTGVRAFSFDNNGALATPLEFILFTRTLSFTNVDVLQPGLPLVTISTAAAFSDGVGFVPSGLCQDSDGDIWAFGMKPGFGQQRLRFLRVVTGGVVGASAQHDLLAPAPNGGGTIGVYGYHYAAASVDHFVCAFHTDRMVLVDRATGAQTVVFNATDQFNTPKLFANCRQGAPSIWITGTPGVYEVSSVDLSVIRSINLNTWIANNDVLGAIFEPINNAIIAFDDTVNSMTIRYLDRVSGGSVTLQLICEDVSQRAGLSLATDVDFAAFSAITIRGYSWTQGTGKAILEPLIEAFDCEVRPHNFLLQGVVRGAALLGTIPVAQMGAGGTARYQVATLLDTDLPLKVSLTHADPAADQQPNTAIGQRSGAAVDSARELSLDASTLVLDVDEARQKADGYLRRTWMKAQTYQLSLTRAWSKLEPGDCYTLALDTVSKAAKLVRLEFGANGVLTTEWERYAPRIHTATSLPGAAGDGLTVGTVAAFGYTKGIALDIPLVRDADDGLILYLAAAPYSATPWPGAEFWRSDDGTTYGDDLGGVTSSEAATLGYTLSALPDALTSVWDRTSTVSVKLFDGALTSATEDEVAAGTNMALLGDELVGFTTATLVAVDTYQLSGFLRGRRGSEWATAAHATGERFVLLSGLPTALMGASDVGDSFYVKPITNGGAAGFPQALTFTGASDKPYSPAHLTVVDSGGDKVATWVRRTRIGGEALFGTTPPLGETTELYTGRVLDAGGAPLRSFTGLTTPTLTYTAAQQSSDGNAGVTLEVWQISSVVGAGFTSTVAL